MTDALSRNAVLLVVDVQKGFDRFNEELHRNNPALEANIARLQRAWRSTRRPLIHVKHLSRLPDSPLVHTSQAARSRTKCGRSLASWWWSWARCAVRRRGRDRISIPTKSPW